MKKFILTFVYGLLCFVPLTLLTNFFEGDSVWIEILTIGFSLFIGSFLYSQFHGIQVMQLKHLGSVMGTSKFQVTLKVSGHGLLNIVGDYLRVSPYTDHTLQARLFKALNKFPGSKWIKEFASDRTKKDLMITIDDPETPYPLNFTQINLEKYNFQPETLSDSDYSKEYQTREELEKSVKGMTKYEIGIKLWEEEQRLLAKARKEGLEEQLIAYWESMGRSKMKEKPIKEN